MWNKSCKHVVGKRKWTQMYKLHDYWSVNESYLVTLIFLITYKWCVLKLFVLVKYFLNFVLVQDPYLCWCIIVLVQCAPQKTADFDVNPIIWENSWGGGRAQLLPQAYGVKKNRERSAPWYCVVHRFIYLFLFFDNLQNVMNLVNSKCGISEWILKTELIYRVLIQWLVIVLKKVLSSRLNLLWYKKCP